MQVKNYVEASLKKNYAFVKQIQGGSLSFYDSIAKIYKKTEEQEIKILRKQTQLYVLVKDSKNLSIYCKDIPDFSKDEETSALLRYSNVLEGKAEIYLPQVLSISLKVFEPKTNEQMRDILSEKLQHCTTIEVVSNLNELTQASLMLNGQGDSDYSLFNMLYNTSIKFSSSAQMLRDYVDVLNEQKCLATNYDEAFYLSLSTPYLSTVNKLIVDKQRKIELFNAVCDKEGLTLKTPLVWCDSDNALFSTQNGFLLKDQNCGFYVKSEKNGDFCVYFLDLEYSGVDKELEVLQQKINNNKIDKVKHLVWSVKDKKSLYANADYMYIFNLLLSSATQLLTKKGYEVQYPVDIKSYEYQKNYYFSKYNLDELDFLALVFVTLGSGFEYNKKEGNFFSNNVQYLENLNIEKRSPYKRFKKINYLTKVNFSYLNAEWTNRLRMFVEVLKKDRPMVAVIGSEDPQKQLSEIIGYLEGKLLKLEKKKKLKK